MPTLRLPEFSEDDLAALLADVLARLDQLIATHQPDGAVGLFTIPHRLETHRHELYQLRVEWDTLDGWDLRYREGEHIELQVFVSRHGGRPLLLSAGDFGPVVYSIGDSGPEDAPEDRAAAGLWLEALRHRLYHWHAA
jgi:hypothetical protein